MSVVNGRLPASMLAPIPGGFMEKHAAAAFNAMNEESVRRFGVELRVRDSYRPLGHPGDLDRGVWSQWAAWERFLRGGNLAADPRHGGTSNHGLGTAVDLATQQQRAVVDRIGGKYGFSKGCSDAPSEWWHCKYNPVCTNASWHPERDALAGLQDRERRLVEELYHLRSKPWNSWSKRRAASIKRALTQSVKHLRKVGHPEKYHRRERLLQISHALKDGTRRPA